MQFRPCIDIHNGKVKQIVGSSLKDMGNQAKENFVSEQDAAFYADMYKNDGIWGGHIILLNASDSDYFDQTKSVAIKALQKYPGGLQIGGGITAQNAQEYIQQGASHVIVTSYVFSDGRINYENLEQLKQAVGKEHIVLDLSCRKKEEQYYVVTDRWQKFTTEVVTTDFLDSLTEYCDEFLIHAVDVEGKANGIEEELIHILGNWNKVPITYAGGIRSFKDLDAIKRLTNGTMNVTIGSALSLFGGDMDYKQVLEYIRKI